MSDLNAIPKQNMSVADGTVIVSTSQSVLNEAQQQMIERLTFLMRGHDNDLTIQMLSGIVQKVLLETLS
ncbi:hypothetical protein ACMYR3_09335 [Ampullimonas aquatilis]|uniref:hypothetical protein n=1 Tax=Ampullimonas aquatilis TaxID=1341549 RepID=UPI003C78169D